MAYPSFAPRLVLAVALVLGPAPDARAGENDLPFPHIRTTDTRLRALIDEATEASPTVRTLIGRITTSDVVVYIACEPDTRIRATCASTSYEPASYGWTDTIFTLER